MAEMVEWGDRKCDDIQIVKSEGVTIQIVFCHVPNPFRMVNCMHGSALISFAGKTQPPMSIICLMGWSHSVLTMTPSTLF